MMKKTNKVVKKMFDLKKGASLSSENEENSKCYVCNQNVSTIIGGVNLLNTTLLTSSSGTIPQKIVKIMGEDCMVLVSEDDLICTKCINLFHKLDRLEIEVTKILDEITNYLNLKYNINATTISIPPQLILPPSQIKRGVKRKYSADIIENQPEIEKQLSEMFGSPVTVTPATKCQKQKIIKNNLLFKCPLCRQGFNDKSQLHFHITDSHLSKHRCNICEITFKDGELLEKHLAKNNCTKNSQTNSADLLKKFKCAICSQKFETKEFLNTHLKRHRTAYFKCGSCGETFQKRDLLMKHLELHTKNKSNNQLPTSTPDNNSNFNLKPTKEIKFLDCKSCALTYIDNDHYSSHLNSAAHRGVGNDNGGGKLPPSKAETVKEEKIDTNFTNQIDLETIFEKLHSDGVIGSGTETSTIDLLQPPPSHTDGSLNVFEPKDKKDQTMNKIYLYKCPGCSGLYDNSNDLQLHILTAGHVDLNSEIQILEVDNTDNLLTNNKITDNQIHLLDDKSSTSNEIKLISLDETSGGDPTNNIQFITTSDEGGEIKFITFQNDSDVRLLQPPSTPGDDSNIKFVDLSNEITLNAGSNSTNKEIQELFQSVVDSSTIPPPTVAPHIGMNSLNTTVSTERSKIQIIDEKTIDISQFININKKNLQSTRQNFQLNDLCTLSIKSENQPNNQITPNILPMVSSAAGTITNTTDMKTLLSTPMMDLKDTTPLIYTSQRKIYKCCRCEFKCLTHETIKAHMTKHNNNNETKTNQSSSSTNLQQAPMMTMIQNDELIDTNSTTTSVTTPTTTITSGITDTDNNDNLDCKICKQTFKSMTLLKRHNNAFHREPICVYCNKQMRNLHVLRIHEQSHIRAGDVCTCDDCGKQFKTKCGLYNHRPVHTGNYKLFCEYCNRGFMSKVVLEEHRSKHTKEERFICDICGKKFQFKSTYWIHRKWHDNPYPYKCNYCNRKFRHTSLLAVHKRKHTGERPYECPHCKQTFAVSGTLKCHLILHTGIYPFTCDICQRGFTTRHKFAVHLSKTHGDSNLLNSKIHDKQNNFKMVIKEIEHNETTNRLEDTTSAWSSTTKNQQDIDGTNLESLIDNHILMNESTEVVSNETVKCINESAGTTSSILNNWYEDDNSSIIASLVDP